MKKKSVVQYFDEGETNIHKCQQQQYLLLKKVMYRSDISKTKRLLAF